MSGRKAADILVRLRVGHLFGTHEYSLSVPFPQAGENMAVFMYPCLSIAGFYWARVVRARHFGAAPEVSARLKANDAVIDRLDCQRVFFLEDVPSTIATR